MTDRDEVTMGNERRLLFSATAGGLERVTQEALYSYSSKCLNKWKFCFVFEIF